MLKNKRNIWGLVLSGGMSKRMGQDKALIEIDGNTQLNKDLYSSAESSS